MILAMILASVYSFFSPVPLKAIDAIQSNASQIAILGVSTYLIVSESSPSIAFTLLFCLMALDTMMSCSIFFEEHQMEMRS